MIADVIVLRPVRQLLSYRIQEGLLHQACIGRSAVVPFRNQLTTGIVIDLRKEKSGTGNGVSIKEIVKWDASAPLLPEKLVELIRNIAKDYAFPEALAFATAIPAGVKSRAEKRWQITEFGRRRPCLDPEEQRVLEYLQSSGASTEALIRKHSGISAAKLCAIEQSGAIELSSIQTRTAASQKQETIYAVRKGSTIDQIPKRAKKQREIFSAIAKEGKVSRSELLNKWPTSSPILQKLLETNCIRCWQERSFREISGDAPTLKSVAKPVLSTQQQEVLAAIESQLQQGGKQRFLLHGVTGSGKTEVYMAATEKTLSLGKGAIILVPEIALTAQLTQRFKDRFKDLVTILHSNLSDAERADQWQLIARGDKRIVVGARSAIFAPIENLGLVVLDEEHDSSYKQDDHLPYHGRQVAERRCEIEGASLLLGSATPSIESFFATEVGGCEKLSLPERISGMQVPKVDIVDMRDEAKQFGVPSFLSNRMIERLRECVEHQKSAILFLNRRGFAPTLLCPSCGESAKCGNCSVTLTYHRNGQLLCHYCGYEEKRTNRCAMCGFEGLVDLGLGTEKLEEHLRHLFPQSRIVRMDRDTTRGKHSHARVIQALENGEVDILVGTQMVTKGLDIPHVRLVGVINADLSVHFPDFRSCERTFQLLTQVSGRAGRGEDPGFVVIQTFLPDHYAIAKAAEADFEGFYRQELKFRKEAGYPPYTSLALLRFSSADGPGLAAALTACSQDLTRRCQQAKVELLGPVPSPLQKLSGKFRWQALIKSKSESDLKALLFELVPSLRKPLSDRGVELRWDLGPYSFM